VTSAISRPDLRCRHEPTNAEVCGCNGVKKGVIVQAIKANGLFTLDEVKKHTKAASSCGSCAGLVRADPGFDPGRRLSGRRRSDKKPMCACTDHSHKAVREAIVAKHLTSKEAVFKALEWKTPEWLRQVPPGGELLPAFQFPARIEGRPAVALHQRAFAHANIQKDGTYSVVPRMWGGLTTPSELRAIADAAEKYERSHGQGYRWTADRFARCEKRRFARRSGPT
jgi:nitrite reductase (NADH) large subunit